MDIGTKLRSVRKGKGYSIYRLAKETGISQNHISGIELGKRQPTIEMLNRLLAPLDLTLVELFNDNSDAMFPSAEERQLIENYRHLPKDKATALLSLSELLKK